MPATSWDKHDVNQHAAVKHCTCRLYNIISVQCAINKINTSGKINANLINLSWCPSKCSSLSISNYNYML